jgi:hypothetical protein
VCETGPAGGERDGRSGNFRAVAAPAAPPGPLLGQARAARHVNGLILNSPASIAATTARQPQGMQDEGETTDDAAPEAVGGEPPENEPAALGRFPNSGKLRICCRIAWSYASKTVHASNSPVSAWANSSWRTGNESDRGPQQPAQGQVRANASRSADSARICVSIQAQFCLYGRHNCSSPKDFEMRSPWGQVEDHGDEHPHRRNVSVQAQGVDTVWKRMPPSRSA